MTFWDKLSEERAKEDAPSTSPAQSKRTDAIAKGVFGGNAPKPSGPTTDWAAKDAADEAYERKSEAAFRAQAPAAATPAAGAAPPRASKPRPRKLAASQAPRADIGQQAIPGMAKAREQSKTTAKPEEAISGGKIDTGKMAEDIAGGKQAASLAASKAPTMTGPAKSRGKFRRAVSAVGRGLGKAARGTGKGLRAAFVGNQKQAPRKQVG